MSLSFNEQIELLTKMMVDYATNQKAQVSQPKKISTENNIPEEIIPLVASINRNIEKQLNCFKRDLLENLAAQTLNTTIQPRHLTLKQAADYTRLSESYIYKLCARQEIPHFKRGKRNYFERESLDEWLLSHRIKTMEEIQEEANTRINNGGFKNGW
jgi:excisionase family DNA binding protein